MCFVQGCEKVEVKGLFHSEKYVLPTTNSYQGLGDIPHERIRTGAEIVILEYYFYLIAKYDVLFKIFLSKCISIYNSSCYTLSKNRST
jgi:hypothetical protein